MKKYSKVLKVDSAIQRIFWKERKKNHPFATQLIKVLCVKGKLVNHSIEIQIKECEELLKEAMLHSDIDALDKLLADNLTFTNHLGQLMTKQDDIEAHKSKILKISEITLSILEINIHKGVAITTVQAYIVGSFNNEASRNNFNFTRAWKKNSNNLWQVIAGHSSIVD